MQDLLSVDWSEIPFPMDDGGAAHLLGSQLPSLVLQASEGNAVDLSSLEGITVIFVYPRTRDPSTPPSKEWERTPGAKGCTPQACAFRNAHADLLRNGAERIFGLSAQTTLEQREAATRLHLPYALLSDHHLLLATALKLPTFNFEGKTLLRRLTMVIRDGIVVSVIYPVFPPDKNAEQVLLWLQRNR